MWKGKGSVKTCIFSTKFDFFFCEGQVKARNSGQPISEVRWNEPCPTFFILSFPHTFPVFFTIRPQQWKTLHLQLFSILAFSHLLGRFACLSEYLTDLLSFHYSCQPSKQSFSFLYSHSDISFLIIHTYPQMMTENLNKQKSRKAFCWG